MSKKKSNNSATDIPKAPAAAKAAPLPGHETQSDEMNCPACGRFVGAVVKCPYCGAKVEKRLSLVAIRWAAILLATVGLFLLYLMARSHEVATVRIADIESTMNFGNVRIEGEVKADAKVNRSGNGMNFRVDDGTGVLMVFVDESTRKEMDEKGLVPRRGDEISFIAQLNANADGVTARVRSLAEDSFSLTPADGSKPADRAAAPAPGADPFPPAAAAERAAAKPAKATPLADVTADFDGKFVTLEGVIASLVPPPADSKRPYVLKLVDGADSVTVKFWQKDYDALPDKEILAGSRVRLRAKVETYEGKLDVKLVSVDQFERLGAGEIPAAPAMAKASRKGAKAAPARDFSRGRATTAATTVSIADLTEALDGQTVTVRARVETVTPPKAGTKQPYAIFLRDGDKTLRASCFSSAWDVIPEFHRPRPDAVFDLTGVVEFYKGKAQLQIKSGYNVKLVDDTPASQPVVDLSAVVPAASVTAKMEGSSAVLRGTLGAPESLAFGGVKYPLTDDSGTIPVVFWENKVPEDLRTQLEEGLSIAVLGDVSTYEGVVQVTAGKGRTVVIAP